MHSKHATATTEILPPDLASPRAKLIYLYLRTEREATIDDLHEALDMAKIALYPILRKLIRRGYVEHEGGDYRFLA
ncbi:helix-turn-helix domain-containing protein [Haladaptatus sp. CMSO5]|uniref:helix-turn-helix domain-containing protein n=1 Tax=Haladaptatus sp. CMSO5 TaxID=3120514 RepID=UPI002FCE4F18